MKIDQNEFLKSSFSGKYGCVGVARKDDTIMVTNTKSKLTIVEFTPYEWECFIRGIKNGEFDHFGVLENE